MKKLVELREEKRIDRIRTLIEILSLEEDFAKYWFNLNPENLMYDRNFRVVVVEKELYQNGERDEDEFLTQYKAVLVMPCRRNIPMRIIMKVEGICIIKTHFCIRLVKQ